jgi:hypothetical protein
LAVFNLLSIHHFHILDLSTHTIDNIFLSIFSTFFIRFQFGKLSYSQSILDNMISLSAHIIAASNAHSSSLSEKSSSSTESTSFSLMIGTIHSSKLVNKTFFIELYLSLSLKSLRVNNA